MTSFAGGVDKGATPKKRVPPRFKGSIGGLKYPNPLCMTILQKRVK